VSVIAPKSLTSLILVAWPLAAPSSSPEFTRYTTEPLSVPTPSVLKAPLFPAGALSPRTSVRETVVDNFEPGSEVSNFDQTATEKRMILHVRPPERLPHPPTPLPPG